MLSSLTNFSGILSKRVAAEKQASMQKPSQPEPNGAERNKESHLKILIYTIFDEMSSLTVYKHAIDIPELNIPELKRL